MRLNVPLAHSLAALALCAAPLLAQANCTNPNTDADYILGEAGGTASAMHWATGVVWKRCLEGQGFDSISNQCTGSGTTKTWNDWAETDRQLLPQSFTGQDTLGITAGFTQNLLQSGAWRMAYKNELVTITENCSDNPKLNRVVFPNAPSWYVWSGSPSASSTFRAWFVHFYYGVSNINERNDDYPVRLVRAGQSFAALAAPAAQTVAANAQTSFDPITLARSVGSGTDEAWGGVRISGDGSPEFQINNTGAWRQEAIVTSGDTLTVRLTAPAAGSSHTATLTLRSGQTTGSADLATLGDEATTMQETSADFTVTAAAPAPVNGACGSANTWPSASAPSSQLCSSGTATTVTGNNGQWQWGCNGQYGGTSTAANACSAVYASQTLNIQANPSSILVNGNSTVTASSSSGLSVTLGISGPCTINGSTVTATNAGFCTVTASQAGTGDAGTNRYLPAADAATTISVTAIPTYLVTVSASPTVGGSVTCSPATVAHGSSSTCTATPNSGYSFSGFSGACSGNSCNLSNVTSAPTVTGLFTQDGLIVPEGPWLGEALSVSAAPTNNWVLTARSAATVASLNAPALPPELTLPYGVVSVRLETGDVGSAATVMLSYPHNLPVGTRYYKYGPTTDDATPHWYAFDAAVISGNTITLTLTDGGAGDDDLSANGVIVDPGGPAVPAAGPMGTPVAVPTLSEWVMLMMAGLLGVLGAGVLRRRAMA